MWMSCSVVDGVVWVEWAVGRYLDDVDDKT